MRTPHDHLLQSFVVSKRAPEQLQAVAVPFATAARDIYHRAPTHPETPVALRALLDAKDAAVRAWLPCPEGLPNMVDHLAATARHYRSRFTYSHLPEHLQEASKPLCELAKLVANGPDNPDTLDALRALQRAKDAAVRAASS